MLIIQTDIEVVTRLVSVSVAFYPNCVYVVEETLGASAPRVFLFYYLEFWLSLLGGLGYPKEPKPPGRPWRDTQRYLKIVLAFLRNVPYIAFTRQPA